MAIEKKTLNGLRSFVRRAIIEEASGELFFKKDSLIYLIFSEDEIRELFNLMKEVGNEYKSDLYFEPYGYYDIDKINDYIINVMDKKNIKLERYELNFLLKLIQDKIFL
jgi:hypothetical protein